MPALPSVPKVIQLAFATHNADGPYVDITRLHFSYTGTAPTPTQLASFATTCLTAWGSALAPSMQANKQLDGLNAIDLSSPTSAVAEVSTILTGALTGDPLPDDAALIMSAKVARRYRGGHPRSYLPVGDSTSLDTGRAWDTTFMGVVLTAWSGFVAAVEAAGWTGAGTIAPVNVSYYQGFTNFTPAGKRAYSAPTLRVGGPVIDAITGYTPRARVGSQRRRIGR